MARDVDHRRFRRCRWIHSPTHDSDHRALVVKLSTDAEVVKRYKRRRQRTLFRKLKKEEMTEGEKMFETLKEAVDPPRRRERPKNSWIRGGGVGAHRPPHLDAAGWADDAGGGV